MARNKRKLSNRLAAKGSPPRQDTEDSQSTSESLVCNGVQCEMGMETLRRYWKASGVGANCGVESARPNAEGHQEQHVLNNKNNSSNENDHHSDSEESSSLQTEVYVKEELEDFNSSVDSKVTEEETDLGTNSACSSQVKIEQGVPAQLPASSSGMNKGVSSVAAPPALHWINPASLEAATDSADGNGGENGIIRAAFLVSGSESNGTFTLGGSNDSIRISLVRTVQTVDGAEVSKIVLKAEQCSESEGVVHADKPQLLTCGDCFDVFTDPSEYEKHCSKHNNDKPFKCLHCSERFDTRLEMGTHMNNHSEKSYLCEKCQESFTDYDEFVAHSRSPGQGCSRVPPTKGTEMLKSVLSKPSLRCGQCNKTFRDADSFKHHQFTHSEGELFPCDECGKTFREEDRLLDHLKLHLKTQTCDLCNEVFTNIFDFNEHYIAHDHDLKVYQCVMCKVVCNNILTLRKHAATHGLRVRSCMDCGGRGHIEFSDDVQDTENATCVEDGIFLIDYFATEVKSPEATTSGNEDDPLRIDADLQAQILSNDPEELEVEMKVDDVLLLEDCDSNQDNSATMDTDSNTKEAAEEAINSRKRRRPGKMKQGPQDDEPKEATNTRPKRTKQPAKNHEAPPLKRTQVSKTAKKADDESQLEVRLELRNRSKRRKSSDRDQESVLLAT